jgi:hypothetical protein
MGEVGRDARSWESKCGISVLLDKGVMIIHEHEHDLVSQANIKVLQANI